MSRLLITMLYTKYSKYVVFNLKLCLIKHPPKTLNPKNVTILLEYIVELD